MKVLSMRAITSASEFVPPEWTIYVGAVLCALSVFGLMYWLIKIFK